MLDNIKRDSNSYAKLSIVVPLLGVGLFVLPVILFLTSCDSEGQIIAMIIGAILGLILLMSAIFGLRFALVSRAEERCRSLSSAGLILNIIILFLLFLAVFVVLFRPDMG